ncbi:hypothetical protein F3087_16105 [Nocardia colli]|uniref:Uncharacterized protein n=1 Tax=Nocardia colli TaxID=2545717 RepID=A0A5N0EHR6_9NOCA|nr:hypothetical protein [Nocardia colli]KAA8888523.1 hypothetical protein F3087_16105 [Nocardia colli]
MALHDVIAQLRQDITTAADAGDEAAADRLRDELSAAIDAIDNTDPGTGTKASAPEPGASAPGLAGTGAAPQPPDTVRRPSADLGPGSYDGNDDLAANIPGSIPEDAQEPPD